MSQSATLGPITDPEEARQFDFSCRVLRAVLWASAVHWAAAVALLKLYLHIPLAAAVALGVLGVAGNLAVERSLWRRNQVRLSRVLIRSRASNRWSSAATSACALRLCGLVGWPRRDRRVPGSRMTRRLSKATDS